MTNGDPAQPHRKHRSHAQASGRTASSKQTVGDGRQGPPWIRLAGFAFVIVAVLGAGVYLAAGDLLGQRGAASTVGAMPVRLSMAGFTPSEIHLKAGTNLILEAGLQLTLKVGGNFIDIGPAGISIVGTPAVLELWTTDAAPPLSGGVHTMISDQLGIHEELPAAGPTGESRELVSITAPATPGTYDIYCNTCCGGKQSPTMHGKLVVEA